MILHIQDRSSGLFFKLMYCISVSEYGIIVYMDFIHPQFALVKILANQITVRLVQNKNACPEIAPIFHGIPDDI